MLRLYRRGALGGTVASRVGVSVGCVPRAARWRQRRLLTTLGPATTASSANFSSPTRRNAHEPRHAPLRRQSIRRTTKPVMTALDTRKEEEGTPSAHAPPAVSPSPLAAPRARGADESVYVGSIHKRLPSRRHARTLSATGSPASASASQQAVRPHRQAGKAGADEAFDPALVVHVDSTHHQLHLNSIQKELVWAARQKEYHSVLHRIVCCLQGHQTPIEKASTLMALHDVVVRQRLRLRVDTYEDIFHLLYATGVASHTRGSVNGHASATPSTDGKLDARLAEEVTGKPAIVAPLTLPAEFATTRAGALALLSEPSMARIWSMYRYLVDSGTDPSPRVLQYVMGLLEHSALEHAGASHSSQQPLIESKAHALLMDADRFRITPTEYTVNAYIGICDVFGVMHLAAARVTDYQTRHQRQASPGMYACLLTGLVRHGHHDEALAMVTTMNSVAMSVPLLNAVLQTSRYSKDPMSAFSLYRAVLGGRRGRGTSGVRHGQGRLAPTIHTFSILLEVLTEQGRYGEDLTFLLDEMRRYRVKGNVLLLNKLLRSLLAASRLDEAASLHKAMKVQRVQVFDELTAQLENAQRDRI